LFLVEVLLRFSTGVEMMLILTGAAIGLWRNPIVPAWAPLALIPFILFNLFLSAGVKQILTRIFERKVFRELSMLLFVAAVALPQVLASTGVPEPLQRAFGSFAGVYALLPWGAAGNLAAGAPSALGIAALLGWTAFAWQFGRRHFERSLRLDDAPPRPFSPSSGAVSGRAGRLYRLPSLLFRDPLAAWLEREIRTLFRSPRFRLILLLGCTLGQLVWLPQSFGKYGSPTGAIATNYLTLSSLYALLLLGDNLFWNSFGFDRSAAQLYFVTPVRLATVLVAKNAVAVFFVLLETTVITLLCLVLKLPITGERTVEAYLVTMTYTLFMLSVGNLASVYQPRPISPAHAWRSSSPGKVQASLLLLYPVLSLPLLLAYGARYAFDSQLAFYAVLLVDMGIGAIVYWVALDSILEAAEGRKEAMLAALSQSGGPMSAA
jgi:ABC-2 type transport system permease protein